MTNQQQHPYLVGATPDPYNGSPDKAIAFWNSLDNYYTMNTDSFANRATRVSAALTHFHLGTHAGEWASDWVAHALSWTLVNYRTWAMFKNDFDKQFILLQTQVEAISKMYSTPQGSWEFSKWYQEWSQHTRRAGVDEATQMYAFRKALNSALKGKVLLVLPQPTTLAALVEKAREFNCNWCMFASPNTNQPC